MHVGVIGAGPAGLLLAAGLSARGHRVSVVDRDPGPAADGSWPRRGVMQFHHAHALRPQVAADLEEVLPDALDRLVALGADVLRDDAGRLVGMRARRQTFETALRAAVSELDDVELVRGHVDAVLADGRRADGLVVDGAPLVADLVVDASGRSGRVTRDLREPPSAGGRCGIAYVDRQYRLRPGADPGPSNGVAFMAEPPGYQVLVFLHEQGVFSVLLVRPSWARELTGLREARAFEAACAAVPGLAEWTDPQRSEPLTDVLPGGEMLNSYRSQRGPDGAPAMERLVFVGDSVCTTTPVFGRGITLAFRQVRRLLDLLDAGTSVADLAPALDDWGETHLRPWVVDHDRMSRAQTARWSGEEPPPDEPLPSDVVLAAAAREPRIGPYVAPYVSMAALPDCLDPAQPLARALWDTGWRPAPSPGPDRAGLARVVADALSAR